MDLSQYLMKFYNNFLLCGHTKMGMYKVFPYEKECVANRETSRRWRPGHAPAASKLDADEQIR